MARVNVNLDTLRVKKWQLKCFKQLTASQTCIAIWVLEDVVSS